LVITIMTFNLRTDGANDGPNSWPYRAHRVARQMIEHAPLVIGIQEGSLAMLTDLGSSLPQYDWVGQGRQGGIEDEFSAIFYDKQWLQVVEVGHFWLSEQPASPGSVSWDSSLPRMCTWGRFRFRQNPTKELMIYNTHLDHVGQRARELGSKLIWDQLCEHRLTRQLPAFVMGDLNATPDNPVIQYLLGSGVMGGSVPDLVDAFTALDEGHAIVGPTFHGFRGGDGSATIDYIFGTSDTKALKTLIDRRMIDGAYASDHYPVIATFALPD